MKGFVQATGMLAVLALCACTSTRAPKERDAEGQVAAPETTAEAPAMTEEEAAAKSEEATTFFGRFFSRLFGGDSEKGDAATAKEDGTPAEGGKAEVLPSPAQEEAALRMLAEQGPDASIPDPLVNGSQTGPLTLGLPGLDNNGLSGMGTGTLDTPDGLKAAPGLRIRNMAPPEEAISADGNANAPKPNSAELKGLRSISLPETLPMDINGKLTKEPEKH